MNPSIKRLLGAVLLIGTLGVSSIMAVRANATITPVNGSFLTSATAFASGECADG